MGGDGCVWTYLDCVQPFPTGLAWLVYDMSFSNGRLEDRVDIRGMVFFSLKKLCYLNKRLMFQLGVRKKA